jgi:hypothetical protein
VCAWQVLVAGVGLPQVEEVAHQPPHLHKRSHKNKRINASFSSFAIRSEKHKSLYHEVLAPNATLPKQIFMRILYD